MGDSDDEYDRKRRDKFRGERDSYRSDRRDDRSKGRDEPYERTRGGRGPPDYRDYRRERNYSPDRPPIKRMRHDWEDMRPRYAPDPYMYGGGGGGGYGGGGHHGDSYHPSMPFGHRPPPGVPHNEPPASADGIPTQPAMMTLKQFLATQDDSISDQDAITKYNEYKVEFRRQQLNEFFVAHKDEEWFKIKYHPEESLKRREEQLEYLKNRVNVFSELLETGDIQKTNVDMPNSEKLIRLLDTVVIKLEGGTEEDLKVLDRKPEPPKVPEVPTPKKEEEKLAEVAVAATEKPETESKDEEVKEKSNDEEAPAAATPKASPKEEKQRRKRKRSNSSDSSSSGSSSSSSSSSSEDEEEKPKSPSVEKEKETPVEVNEEKEPEKEDVEMKEPEEEKKSEGDEVKEDAVDEETANKSKDEEEGETKADDEEEKRENERERTPPETIDVDQPKEVVRELHRTSSIFLRNLAPTITKAEVEAMCKRYAGFLRVAIADPLVERRWFRRGWVTFQREVNFKEICWNLNNIRLRDCELGAIVNRDLSRRVRPVNGITVHRNVVRSDIKLAAKICHNLDIKAVLWADMNGEAGEKNGTQAAFGFDTKNPVLQNITDYLIEEASAEEDELLGLTKEQGKEGGDGEIIERDAELLGVLDKIILYLRIVHSVDFYNHCEYPYEDEMPNRCGIIHARGPVPQNKVTQNEISEYIRNFEQKMSSFLAKTDELSDEELKKLGTKDADAEVEKFIKANSQELGKDKWLCPLSGKKFKGPDFIRKHIFNKHSEKVEEVRKEVTYFNNYLKDPKRPQLPENPANTRKQTPEGGAHNQPSYRPPPYGVPFGMPYGGYPMMGRGRGGYRGSEFLPPPAVVPADNRRKVVAYNDLDTLAFEDSFI